MAQQPTRRAPPPVPPTPAVQAFLNAIAPIAQQYGVNTLVITLVDPGDGQAKLFGALQALSELRDITAEKFGLFAGEDTGWT